MGGGTMSANFRGANPAHLSTTEEASYDDLLAEVEALRARIDAGAAGYEELQVAYATTHAALVDVAAAALHLVQTARRPTEGGRLHIVSGPAFRALQEVMTLLEEEDEP